ncbi:PilZ domain-containing protein [Nitratidesulfovibrio sp. 1201_IL3209]|uniref:PilZ domain-containing protein n=1 Tax=Nitratidesulfovibrio sp. 1201_IL3209 TaxID=3084053 RepID=UPI002FD9C2B1
MTDSTSDRRKHCRLPKPFPVEASEIRFPPSSQGRFETQCCDISAGGLSVHSPRKFEPGAKLQVRVHIPTLNKYSPGFFKVYENDADQYLQAIAEVIRVEYSAGGYLLGLKYVDVDEDAARAVANLVNKAVLR